MQLGSKWYQDVPLVIAHRGASFFAPENTMAVFNLAVEVGSQAIEMDAKLSRDGEVVIIHDSTLDRISNGTGLVKDHEAKEIRQMDAGSHFGDPFVGERSPFLSEVFDCMAGELLFNGKLTNYRTLFDRLPKKVISLIAHSGIENDVLLSSFNPIALKKSKQISPEIPTGLLVRGSPRQLINRMMRSWITYDCYHPAWGHVSKDLIRKKGKMGNGFIFGQ